MNISIKSKTLIASINPKGAELISLKSNNQREYIWEGNPTFWGKHSPILFPIVGTLKNNQYQHNNQMYSLPRHGFARDMHFELVSKTESTAVFSLQSNTQTKTVYPFDFELQVHYVLQENNLQIGYRVINKSSETMPFSIGAHPAFALPQPFENYALAFEFHEDLKSYVLENDLLSENHFSIAMNDKTVPLSYSLFENDALILKTLRSRKITIMEDQHPILNFYFDDFKNFGIWTKADAPFICLEPWLGYSDTLSHNGNLIDKEAIQKLEAQKEFICTFKIEIL